MVILPLGDLLACRYLSSTPLWSHAPHKAHFKMIRFFFFFLVPPLTQFLTATDMRQTDKELLKCYLKALKAFYLKWQQNKDWRVKWGIFFFFFVFIRLISHSPAEIPWCSQHNPNQSYQNDTQIKIKHNAGFAETPSFFALIFHLSINAT